MNDDQTRNLDFSNLKRLDLSENAVASYEALYLEGPQTASGLAKLAHISRTSAYYALEQLEQKGFVKRDKDEIMHRATRFWAIRLDKALENLAIYQRRTVQELIDRQIERSIQRQTVIGARIIDRDWR